MKAFKHETFHSLDECLTSLVGNNKLLAREFSTLKNAVFGDPTRNSNRRKFLNQFKIRTRKKNDLLCIAILHWYMPKEVRVLVNLELRDLFRGDLSWMKNLLLSKEICLCWILEFIPSPQALFGNILCKNNFNKIHFWIRPSFETKRKPTRKEYRRGPKDQGTLGSNPYLPEHFAATAKELVLYQERKEMQRRLQRDQLLVCQARLRKDLEVA
jgi:hypothetical protein